MDNSEDKTWQQRLRAEFDDLDQRTEKLRAFMGTEAYSKLDREDRILLSEQSATMIALRIILGLRLSRSKV